MLRRSAPKPFSKDDHDCHHHPNAPCAGAPRTNVDPHCLFHRRFWPRRLGATGALRQSPCGTGRGHFGLVIAVPGRGLNPGDAHCRHPRQPLWLPPGAGGRHAVDLPRAATAGDGQCHTATDRHTLLVWRWARRRRLHRQLAGRDRRACQRAHHDVGFSRAVQRRRDCWRWA